MNIVTISSQGAEQDDQYFAAAATMLVDLANTDGELSHAESNMLRSFERVLANSIERNVNASVAGTLGGRTARLTAKDLMSEVERVLSKASGAMSLLERL